MIWLQGGIAFLLWIGYGAFQARRAEGIRRWALGVPRPRRALTGGALILVGAMVLLGGLAIVLQLGGFTARGLTLAGWMAVAALGLAFVHAQTLATALLVTLMQPDVTNQGEATSLK